MNKPSAIVGIGASAGGLEALQKLVQAIPKGTGIAFVVVQHLAPDHPSIMDRLLREHAKVAVSKIEDGARLEADHVYVIPAGPFVEIRKGRFVLIDHEREEGVRTPIDRFFASLAKDVGRNAFAVVLSGTGSDGTIGVRSIKENGGIALVQESESAQFPGMPRSAAATGLVDFVLRAENIPGKIIEIVEHRRLLDRDGARDRQAEEVEARLPEILAAIDEDANISFTDYKPGTLIRRVMRRMTILRQSTVDDYLETLEETAEERLLLSQDFLIGVTEFFRDPEGFHKLATQVLRPILERDTRQIRIWVPGCSTGEEAFTIAILVDEIMRETGQTRHVQIFGTDVDSDALRHARQGRYAEAALNNVSEERRTRYFQKANDFWRVLPRLREMCVFAPHDLLGDPPFSRLDLISCRNVMIYLSAEAQASVIPKFHYALNASGYLWLGPSETLGRSERFFLTKDRGVRLFQRNDDVTRAFSALDFEKPRPKGRRQQPAPEGRATPVDFGPAPPRAPGIGEEAEQAFLTLHASPFAIISRTGEVLYLSESMTRFVKPTKGVPATNIEDFLTSELRLPVQSAVDAVIETRMEADIRDVIAGIDGKPSLFDVVAAPFRDSDEQIMIVLKEVRQRGTVEHSSGAAQSNQLAETERELALTRRRLHTVEREFEAVAQDLRSSNEELLTMNEEMQSSNEELETSREELQSINEELETINAELTENNRQLTRSNSDLQNLLQSTDVAILFLDETDCVRLYTPPLEGLFGVQQRDIGRPIHQLSTRLDYPELKQDAAQVARTLEPRMREVRDPATDETFEARIRPYRTVDNRLEGVVIVFQDVTTRRRNERQLAENARVLDEQLSELSTLYDTAPVGLSLVDADLRYVRMNERLAEINGIPARDHIGRLQEELLPEIHAKVMPLQRQVIETGEPVIGLEVIGKTPADPHNDREWLADFYPVITDGKTVALGSCVREVTAEKRLQRALTESEARMRRLFDDTPASILLYEGADHRIVYLNAIARGLSGARDIVGMPLDDAFPAEAFATTDRHRLDEVYRTGEARSIPEHKTTLPDGPDAGFEFMRIELVPWYGPSGEIGGVMTFGFDISDQRNARAQQDILLAELQHRVKNTLAIVQAIVRASARTARSKKQLEDALLSRLAAVSRNHEGLTAGNWQGQRLKDLIETELMPFLDPTNGRYSYDGPDLMLEPKVALTLGLAFHELATNAAKYGALTEQKGRIEVDARADDGKLIRLEWREIGGPAVEPPEDEGFGTFLLKRIVGAELRADVRIDYERDGLRYLVEKTGLGGPPR